MSENQKAAVVSDSVNLGTAIGRSSRYADTNLFLSWEEDGKVLVLKCLANQVIGQSDKGNDMCATSGGYEAVAFGDKQFRINLNIMG